MISLSKVRTDVLCHRLEDQVVVYDPRSDSIHLLDQTTACVMDLLTEGGRTVEEVTDELARRINYQPSPGLLMLAIEELRRADLLDQSEGPRKPMSGPGMFRRAMVKKVAAAGATALLVPLVVSLSPGAAYGQASTCIAHHTCCTPGQRCFVLIDTCATEKACDKTTGFQCK